jgi:hypothetical protein
MSVYRVPTVHIFRGLQVIRRFQRGPCDLFDDVHELVDRHRLVAVQFERLLDVAGQNHLSVFKTIVGGGGYASSSFNGVTLASVCLRPTRHTDSA